MWKYFLNGIEPIAEIIVLAKKKKNSKINPNNNSNCNRQARGEYKHFNNLLKTYENCITVIYNKTVTYSTWINKEVQLIGMLLSVVHEIDPKRIWKIFMLGIEFKQT